MTRHMINETLFDVAEWRLRGEQEKLAFVPQGSTDPAAAMGAAGGMPPALPSAGGMPPGDPMAAAAGGMPLAPPPVDPMAAAGGMGMMPPGAAPAPAAPGAAPGAAGGKPKIDPTFIYMELARVRKLLTHMMKHTGVEMPADILDDGVVGQVAQGQMPESAPLGQGGETEQAGLPALGGAAPVGPIEPAAAGGAGGGVEKPASDVLSLFRAPAAAGKPDFVSSQSKLDALAALSRSLGR